MQNFLFLFSFLSKCLCEAGFSNIKSNEPAYVEPEFVLIVKYRSPTSKLYPGNVLYPLRKPAISFRRLQVASNMKFN